MPVFEELERIRAVHKGIMRANDIARYAESSDEFPALHAKLTWDNKKAAKEHRKHQARSLLQQYYYPVLIERKKLGMD